MPISKVLTALWARIAVASLALGSAHFQAQGQTPTRALAPPAAVPVEAFFSPAKLQQASLSPSGRWLAALTAVQGRRLGFQIIDLDGKEQSRFIEASPKDDVIWFRWVGDERLVFELSSPNDRSNDRGGNGLMAVQRDGSGTRRLIAREFEKEDPYSKRRYLEPDHAYLAPAAAGRDEVIVGKWEWRNREFSHITPLVLNVTTGGTRTLAPDAPRASGWFFDVKGRARVASQTDKGETTIWWADKNGAWREIVKAPSFEMPFTPFAADGDDDLLVTTRAGSDGSLELRRFDFKTGKPEATPIVATPGFDTLDNTVFDRETGRVLGFTVTTDAASQVWLSPAMKALQAKVDAKFPGTVNTIQCRPCDGTGRLLVFIYSDVQPGSYALYSPASDRWQLVGEVRPDIDPQRMQAREFHRTRARDGGDLPIWVTRPAISQAERTKPAPAVVLVHGGPWLRGADWNWDAEVQFLASRGYVVIEPEFRGSEGYGVKHFRAGFKQWGLTMQDDVTDALRFAVAQGWVDSKRVCLMGASYGGYATLMGLAKDPDQYRCGLAHAAVSDQRFMFDFHWSDLTKQGREYDLPVLLGDREKDAPRFIVTSPLEQVARIKAPLLLSHGGQDRRVPLDNATRMLDALRKNGKPVEWVEYKDEGHSFFFPDNRYDYYRRVEIFLAQHLK